MKKESALNVTRKAENEWKVMSDVPVKSHQVQKTSLEPCPCSLKCPLCDACVHTLSCTCMDFDIRRVVCGHIHAASMYSSKQSDITIREPLHIDIDIDQKRDRLSELIPKNSAAHSSLEDTRKKVRKELAELGDFVANVPNVDTLQCLETH